MMKAGLLATCLGALLLALSTHLGGVTGFVGTAVWAALGWRLANVIGWLLLILGFGLQYVSVRQAARPTRRPGESEALLNVLERKGLLAKTEVLDEIKRLRAAAPAPR